MICLPVGLGLLRLRPLWRRCTRTGAWFGYAILLISLGIVVARANGAKIWPGPGGISFDLFGWQPNAAQTIGLGVVCLCIQAALLVWLQLELRRPKIKALFEQRRGKGTAFPELLVLVVLVLFVAGWMPWEVRQVQSVGGAAAETWSPTLASGESPDLTKLRDDIKNLKDQTNYPGALQRQIWYFNHALEYDPSLVGVRLSFTLSDWVELGRSYPEARQALVQIRDHDLEVFSEGMRYPHWFKEIGGGLPGFSRVEKRSRFALFQDITSINGYLGNEDTNRALIKALVARDPQLAQSMGYKTIPDAFDQLVTTSTNGVSQKNPGDGQAAFAAICQQWITLKKHEVRLAKISSEGQKRIAGQQPPGIAPPMGPPKVADSIFVDKTRQLIEILVANGHKADAEQIRDQALALLNDIWLKSAVSDAETKIQGPSAAVGH